MTKENQWKFIGKAVYSLFVMGGISLIYLSPFLYFILYSIFMFYLNVSMLIKLPIYLITVVMFVIGLKELLSGDVKD